MNPDAPLVTLSFPELIGRFAARTPTPGGGAAAGLVGALGAALGAMALRFSIPPGEASGDLPEAAGRLELGARDLAAAADQDCQAYEAVRSARRLPRETPEQRQARAEAVAQATLGAMESPLDLLGRLAELAAELASRAGSVKPALASDLASAAWCLRAAAEMAWRNVSINASDLPQEPRSRAALERGRTLLAGFERHLGPLLLGQEEPTGDPP